MPNASFLASILIAAVLGSAAGPITWSGRSLTDKRLTELHCSPPRGALRPDASVIGTVLPRFELTDIDGVLRSPEDHGGKVSVINYWATGAAHAVERCRCW